MARKAVHSLPPLAARARFDDGGLAITQPAALANLAGGLIRADLMERSKEHHTDPTSAIGQSRGVQLYTRRWQALLATSRRRVLLGEVLAGPEQDPDEGDDEASAQPHD